MMHIKIIDKTIRNFFFHCMVPPTYFQFIYEYLTELDRLSSSVRYSLEQQFRSQATFYLTSSQVVSSKIYSTHQYNYIQLF